MQKRDKSNDGDLRDIYAATPFGRKGREALYKLGIQMTEEEFIENVYVLPLKSLKEDRLPDEDKGFDPDEYFSETEYSELEKTGFDTKKISGNERDKEDFENDFIINFSKALYRIIGSAGCGKTTYFHYLWHEMSQRNDTKLYLCDLEKSTIAYRFLGIPFEFDKHNNVWIFVGVILQEILHNIFYTETLDNNGNDITSQFIRNTVRIYHQYLHVPDSASPKDDELRQVALFTQLDAYTQNIDRKVFFADFGEYVISEIEKIKDKGGNDSEKEAVAFVTGIAIRMFFCLSKMEGKKKRYVFAIDSVEHYMHYQGQHRIQNSEIGMIVDGLKIAADWIRPRIDEIREYDVTYMPFYAIVIMMRETSETIIEYTEQQIEYGSLDTVSIYISEWFDAKYIMESKEKYLEDYIQDKDQLIKEVINNVKSDVSLYRWGLHGLITRMYNNNQRGISDCLVNALRVKSNAELKWFNDKWSEVQSKKLKELKHLCRQYIFRLLLDYVEETKYFDRIMAAVNGQAQDEKTSYARRIATTLYNALEKGTEKDFVSFPYLIESVLVSKEGCQPSDRDISNLGEILWIMNDPDTDETHWNALVEIKFDPKEQYDKDTLVRVLQKEWKDKNYSTKKYGVRIRTSGKFFADFVPEFEYFACRSESYGKHEPFPPLFELDNLRKNARGHYYCILIIQGVLNHAAMCMDNVIKWETQIRTPKWLYKRKKDSKAEVHPARIVIQHIGYLKKYCIYVENHITDNECSLQDRQAIVRQVNTEIEKYERMFEDRKRKNPIYFNYRII